MRVAAEQDAVRRLVKDLLRLPCRSVVDGLIEGADGVERERVGKAEVPVDDPDGSSLKIVPDTGRVAGFPAGVRRQPLLDDVVVVALHGQDAVFPQDPDDRRRVPRVEGITEIAEVDEVFGAPPTQGADGPPQGPQAAVIVRQQADAGHSPRPRLMMSSMISDVPAKIVYTRASRKSRAMGYSSM